MFIQPKRVQCFLAPVKCGNDEEALNDNSFVQTHVSLIVSIIAQELILCENSLEVKVLALLQNFAKL